MIRVSEIFGPTIQGEGALIGQPTIFVRTGGCDYRCAWCDTLHAVDSEFRHEWKTMTAEDIFEQIEILSGGNPIMVSLSGGNPAIHDLKPLIALGKSKNYRFALETQGSIAQNWFADLDILTLSPKPPSSGMNTDWNQFDACLKSAKNKKIPSLREGLGEGVKPDIKMKIIIFNDEDYEYAKEAAKKYPNLPLYLQPGNHIGSPDANALNDRLRWLAEKVTGDKWFHATVLPQLHVLMWGNKRGV